MLRIPSFLRNLSPRRRGAGTQLYCLNRGNKVRPFHNWPSCQYDRPAPLNGLRAPGKYNSRWKDNQYFFYSETSIELPGYPLLSPKARFTAEQVGRIIAYARQRHVDVVPCVELYGHLHDLFRIERYADLAVIPHGQDFNAVEMVGRWQQLGAHPRRRQVVSTLNDLCCLDHFPGGNLMDGITELREDYRPAWLAEYTRYRLGTLLGKFDREFLYWYGFTRWVGKLREGFRDGDTLPPLESYRSDY